MAGNEQFGGGVGCGVGVGVGVSQAELYCGKPTPTEQLTGPFSLEVSQVAVANLIPCVPLPSPFSALSTLPGTELPEHSQGFGSASTLFQQPTTFGFWAETVLIFSWLRL
ncbi:MAG: hypothetical protein M3384_07970 [Acidobacteriota bacterium]|nr:hypothetical protein [Acidobacteriota bacterium]